MTTSPVDSALLARTDWDADSYLAAAERGDFGDVRVELIDGEVIEMAPPNPPHGFSQSSLQLLLGRRLDPAAWAVFGQHTVRLGIRDVPEPDVWVARGTLRDYSARYAEPSDIVLMAETGDSSRLFDRNRKLPRYALAGVREVWLVDLVDRVVEVCTEPAGDDYASRVRHVAGETLHLVVDGTELASIEVNDLLP